MRRRKLREETFTCKICYEQYEDASEILPLDLCEHVFHQECLSIYLQTEIAGSKFPLICPDDQCKCEMADLDVKELLTHEEYTKYTTFTLNQAID
jgi:hypothetical protein